MKTISKSSALPAAKPRFIEPMYARTIIELPEGSGWQYEIKLDGYRCLAGRDERNITLWSRRANLFTNQFPHIAAALEKLKRNTLLDGEIVALDQNGRVSFNLLQNFRSQAAAIHYYVFDLLIYEGKSLLRVPLQQRRTRLVEALEGFGVDTPIRSSDAIEAPPAVLVNAAKEIGLEGVVAKRRESCYEPGMRTGSWLKYKINKAQAFVVGGYTPGNPLDAVIVGYWQEGKLLCAGKVRNGFVPHLRRQIYERLKHLEAKACPFDNLPERKRTPWAITRAEMKNCIWLKPELVAQIEFADWTVEDQLRHAKFVGLREDKACGEVVREGLLEAENG